MPEGGLDAGQALAEICMAGLGWASILPGDMGGVTWPHVFVTTDHPTAACLFSQYAGWQISTDGFFAMGSGPMRAAYAHEELFARFDYREEPSEVVGVLEGRKLPTAAVVQYICERTGVTSDKLCLLIAPTASQAGNVQVVARSVETALHKLLELGFDVRQVQSACGSAPLPPVAANDMAGIGRTNDAILYGARVTLWVRGADAALAEIGPSVPACSSAAFGKPFLEVFEEAGRDFYKIDKQSVQPGRNHVLQSRQRQCPSLRPDRAGHHEDGLVRDRRNVKIALLAQPGSWYSRELTRAAVERGHRQPAVRFPKLVGSVGGHDRGLAVDGDDLLSYDAVIVRTMPPGSLEQVVYRMDALWRLAAAGVVVLNPPKALECAVDKYLALVRLESAGLTVPATIVCENAEAALEAFDHLGGDVVVKPIFGSEGRGIVRVSDPRPRPPHVPHAGTDSGRAVRAAVHRERRFRRAGAGAWRARAGRHAAAGQRRLPRATFPAGQSRKSISPTDDEMPNGARGGRSDRGTLRRRRSALRSRRDVLCHRGQRRPRLARLPARDGPRRGRRRDRELGIVAATGRSDGRRTP